MKKFLILALSAMMLFSMTTSAFAANLVAGSTPTTSVPVTASFAAQSISFSISEQITAATTASDKTVLEFSDFEIENTMNMGALDVTKLEATGFNGWSVIADGTAESWKQLPFDAKKLSVVATINGKPADLATGFNGKWKIPYGEKKTSALTGHTGAVSNDITSEKVASIVATVAVATE